MAKLNYSNLEQGSHEASPDPKTVTPFPAAIAYYHSSKLRRLSIWVPWYIVKFLGDHKFTIHQEGVQWHIRKPDVNEKVSPSNEEETCTFHFQSSPLLRGGLTYYCINVPYPTDDFLGGLQPFKQSDASGQIINTDRGPDCVIKLSEPARFYKSSTLYKVTEPVLRKTFKSDNDDTVETAMYECLRDITDFERLTPYRLYFDHASQEWYWQGRDITLSKKK